MKAFSAIASEWDFFRKEPSPFLKTITPLIPKNPGKILDAGCGNGRNAVPLSKLAGRICLLDSSKEMVALSQANLREAGVENAEFKVGRFQALPYPDSHFAAVLCIAALHHLKTGRDRKLALREFLRVLEPGGVLLATVWNRRQPRFEGIPKNALIPWKSLNGKTTGRFYHFFTPKELEGTADGAGFGGVKVWGEKGGALHPVEGSANLCLLAKKMVI